ncbi:HTH_Tnp_Tc3_2 domain-containing protein [Trichonephila clavipes]|nr:HTH_Tnp_Tc3_2 domain-containing protein [Trichonephila clavipes]
MATVDREDRVIFRLAVTAPESSLSTIRSATHTRMTIITIHAPLIKHHLNLYQPLRHLPLTPAQCQVRLRWCLAQLGRNHADWGRIVFSDKSRFQLCPDDHRRRVRRRPGQRANPVFTIARHTGCQPGVMVWGTISFEAGPLWLSLEAHLQPKGASTTF